MLNKKIPIYVVLIILACFTALSLYIEYKHSQDIKERLKTLRNEREQLINERSKLIDCVFYYQKLVDESYLKLDSLNNRLDSISKIRKQLPKKVKDLPISQIDSILIKYKR